VLVSAAVRLPPLPALSLLAGVVPLALTLLALQREAPLFLNLGAGDASFARGFRGGWERDGLQGSGETMFRWTQDGARLQWPVVVRSGTLAVRLRLARFLGTPAEMTLQSGSGGWSWQQPPRGWSQRAFELGPLRGPLELQFRSQSADPDGLGVALDWAEVRGAERVWPRRDVLVRLIALCLGFPLLLALGAAAPRRAVWIGAAATTVVGVTAVALDRLGGLTALAAAAAPVLVVTAALALAGRVLRSRGHASPDVLLPGVFALAALVALSHPGYYYPDVDTHGRFLAAGRQDPRMFWDPAPYQLRTGAWTRDIGGVRVAFPYSPAFHLLAWPLAMGLGDVPAVKTLAVLAVVLTLLLARVLAASAGLDGVGLAIAPLLVCLLPVVSSRLTLALYPALLGQALELLVLVLLVRDPRSRALAAAVLLALVAYTGSLLTLTAMIAVWVTLALVFRERAAARRVALVYACALPLVAVALYARFLPVLLNAVIPHAGGEAAGETTSPWTRLRFFYDTAYPLLALGGLALIAAGRARRTIAAALVAGLALLLLRVVTPVLVRDAKEMELLAAPIAVCAAAVLAALARRGRLGAAVSAVALAALSSWGALRAAGAYAQRFVAIGR
jgi:hypothetical protein